ncbi:ArpU family phage packaging/lysis transcriptional regulator [Pediococcus acidilactici]|uniref:ArpU family phage packaging/lysis transcriptional regulator n=1 Tax=Pediococcus acidilactici TaxID=1254 RepID=UPI002F266211
MSLLPELDEVKTIEKVKCFFEKDFPTLQNMAHTAFVDVKSPVISGMPVSHSADNGAETKVTLHMYAKDILNKVIISCGGLDYDHRHVLELRYFKQLTWSEIEELTGYNRGYENKKLNEALLQFAWAFVDVEDLRVFNKISTNWLHKAYNIQFILVLSKDVGQMVRQTSVSTNLIREGMLRLLQGSIPCCLIIAVYNKLNIKMCIIS